MDRMRRDGTSKNPSSSMCCIFWAVPSPLMHVVNSIGETLVPAAAQAILDSLAGERWISPAAARLIGAALSDQAYRDVPVECRDRLRAKLMKQMLTALNM